MCILMYKLQLKTHNFFIYRECKLTLTHFLGSIKILFQNKNHKSSHIIPTGPLKCHVLCIYSELISSLSPLDLVPVSVPVIEKSPSQPVVEDKSNVTWTCAVHSGTRVRFQWLRDDVALAPSERYHFSGDNATLSISPVRKEDRGRYRCLAGNPVSRWRYSMAKELTVYCKLVVVKHRQLLCQSFCNLTCHIAKAPFSFTLRETLDRM